MKHTPKTPVSDNLVKEVLGLVNACNATEPPLPEHARKRLQAKVQAQHTPTPWTYDPMWSLIVGEGRKGSCQVKGQEMKYRYLTCCVHSTAEKIHAMVDAAVEVSFATIKRHCADIHQWAHDMGYAVGGERGLHLKDDWAVSYYRSFYNGQPCYFISHSAIEHIFTPE